MKRLWVLMAVCFVDMMGLMLVAPLMPFYALDLKAPEWLVGPLIASFAVAQLVSSPIWGKFSDRYGRRPAMLIGLGASAFAYVIFGFATSLWMLFASRIVQGLGGGTTGVAQAYVADTMQPKERAKALGWLSAKLLRNSTFKTYKGFPHGMPTTQADTINADLLAFIQT